MSDLKLRQDVMDELEFEPSVNATHIGVAVDNGVVTLTGHVGTYFERLAAEQAARRVKGVRAIAEEIEVRYPFSNKIADDEIAKRAADMLDMDVAVPKNRIAVTVRDGQITLSGQVDWQYQRRAAEKTVAMLSGVSGVVNHVTIRPSVQPADIKRKIEDALKRHAEVEARGIKVGIADGGKVTLEGTVHDWHEREAAQKAAWSAPGVVLVDDRLVIA
ncbi:MAG TPA: BON domain-containing protein [Rhizomicrobium sp.]|nr:BON domain-containing protein [Rhizomicrobium sp.]